MESQPQNPEFRINPETFTYDVGVALHPSQQVFSHIGMFS